MIDHITYQVPRDALTDEYNRFTQFFSMALGLKEVDPEEPTGDYEVRWWEDDSDGTQIHIVEGEDTVSLELGHFCIRVSDGRYALLKDSQWCRRANPEHDRIWVEGPCGIRVEVRGGEPVEDSEQQAIADELAAENWDVEPKPNPQQMMLMKALNVYNRRNAMYGDNWTRYGWRGCLYDLRRKVERAWDSLWDAEPASEARLAAVDDLLDAVNYAAITARAVGERNRDGEGRWW